MVRPNGVFFRHRAPSGSACASCGAFAGRFSHKLSLVLIEGGISFNFREGQRPGGSATAGSARSAGKHVPTDNDAFIVYRDSARLSSLSTGVQCCTLNPAKLLKNDGTIDASQIVRTVPVPEPGNREDDAGYSDGTLVLNLS